MAVKKKPRRSFSARRRVFRKKVCKFCANGKHEAQVDFRDVAKLSKFTSERGKMLPSRVTGTCLKCQRKLSRAIKRARATALMPYIAETA